MLPQQRQLNRQFIRWLTALIIVFQFVLILQTSIFTRSSDFFAKAEETSTSSTSTTAEKPEKKKYEIPLDDKDIDWGTFYDPKGVFCGDYDCYKILGFDYTTFHVKKPSLKEITQSYRALSRAWHPDKNKRKGAKERFVKIAKAYEILADQEKRDEYDYYRDRPDEYFLKYGSSVMWTYAPQSDARFIIFIVLILATLFSHYAQKQRWQTVADHLIKAAVEDWGNREGGSIESSEIRQEALEILAKQQEAEKSQAGESINNSKHGTTSKKKGPKLTKKEKKELENEELRKIVVELVNKIDDFGGGFRKPTWKDLLVIKLARLPITLTKAIAWNAKFYFRRLRRLDYSEEEIEVMTKISVGDIGWAAASEEEKKEMLTLELWKSKNLEDWREDQRVKMLSSGDQKRHARMKKKEGKKNA